MIEPQTPLLNDVELPLESVDITDKLKGRPTRPPNFELEANSLKKLSNSLLEPKSGILQDLTDIILEVCRADSAGISIVENEGTDEIFRWHALSGQLKDFLHGTMPRNFSPCGVVVDRCSPLLLEKPIRHWGYIEKLGLPLYEVLLAPFFRSGKAVGTVWAISHRADKTFDFEDQRLLKSLAEMANLAVETDARMTELKAANRNQQSELNINERSAREIANERDNLLRLFDANPSPNVLWRGKDLVYERVSPTYQALFPNRQLIGKPFLEAAPEPEYVHFFDIIRGVFDTGHPVTLKEQLVKFDVDGDGMKDQFYTLSFFQVKDADGQPYGVYQQAVDNTEQVQAREILKSSAQALEAEQLKLRTVIENSTASIAVLRGDNFIFDMTNKSYAELFKSRDLIGKPLTEALPELRDQEFPKHAKSVFETGTAYVDREALALLKRTAEGPLEKRYFDQSYSRILDPEGKPYGIFMHAHEVTERVIARMNIEQAQIETEGERQKLKSMIDVSPIGIGLMRGLDLIFEMVNSQFIKLVGQREYVGRKWQDVYAELPNSPLVPIMRQVLTSGEPYSTYEMPIRVEVQPGIFEDRFYDFTYAQVKDGEKKPYGVYLQCSNVTERVIAKRQLEENLITLETAKSEAVQSREEAERANETKSAFLANMSHEIRTPLGAILGFTDLLRESNLESQDRDRFLDTISRNGKALTRIIDDILDLAKVESGKLEVEMVDFSLTSLVDEVMDLFRERTQSKELYLRALFAKDAPSRVVSDPTRLRQILINIVGNAVKFTHEGGVTISVDQESRIERGVLLRIGVKDTGVGLTPEQRKRLFQPFVQADNSTTRKFGGTGLGLSLSQRLAQALGGSISIDDSHSVGGCTFEISVLAELPKVSSNTPKLNKSAIDKSANLSLSGLQILVADDSADNQFLVDRMLTKFGAVVTRAENGLVAFRKTIEGNFDLVLMDIQMPEMDGYEATRSLREAGFKKPIIALTAHAMAEERARTAAAGCDGHLTKPLNQSELIETVLRHVKKSSV